MASTGFSLNLQNDPGRWLKRQMVGSKPTDIMVDLLAPRSPPGGKGVQDPPASQRLDQVGATLHGLLGDERTREVTPTGLAHLHALLSSASAPGVEMSVHALEGIQPSSTIASLAPGR
jgi:hypothetical protein